MCPFGLQLVLHQKITFRFTLALHFVLLDLDSVKATYKKATNKVKTEAQKVKADVKKTYKKGAAKVKAEAKKVKEAGEVLTK